TLARWRPYKNDIALRIPQLPVFIDRVQDLISREYADFEVVWYGHIGDGNLHLNVLQPENADSRVFARFCSAASHRIAALVGEYGGSISAEHGVGLLKKELLGYTRSATEIDAMRAIKRVFDPYGIMNPGKVFD
ncbi:MAG: FAD-binding oxidoreductase, partial [Pseudomonadales bacterium]|nr:FAD-binding oxidoreductase [Pseudomonadales bacterium]